MEREFSGKKRTVLLNEMVDHELDLLIIGGGITGAGIALDAATRGMKTGLVEMQDFAAGTSSRSTKLVHGGLRYLKQFHIKMVADVGKERAIVYENGPHVTTPEWMLLPIYKGGTFGKFSTSIGLRVYDYLASVAKGERRKMLSRSETLKKVPGLKRDGLQGSGYYVEYRTDDARLTIEVMKKAVEKGANAVNYAKVKDFIYEKDKVVGVRVVNQLTGESYSIRAKKIVNAAGPWVDDLREKDKSKRGKTLHLTKGVHLIFDRGRFPLNQAVYFDTPDGRMVFAIPRNGKTYVGTTDTNYDADIAHPRMTESDRRYVIDAINFMFPDLGLTADDVESSYAGLRPLIHEEGKDPSEISRKDEIFISHSGLITIAGGKLTGYRKMAESVVDLVADQLKEDIGRSYPTCETKHLPISGGDVGGSNSFPSFIKKQTSKGIDLGLGEVEAKRLAHDYGSNVGLLHDIIERGSSHIEQHELPLSVYAQIMYGIEREMVVKPVDFFIRRTGALFFDIQWVEKWKEPVIQLMADIFGWTHQQRSLYREELEKQLHDAVTPID